MAMQEFVYCTDIHYGCMPVCRKDDYNQEILDKFQQCLKLAKEKGCPLLVGGDMFDKPNQSFFNIIKMVALLNKYHQVQVIVNRGNFSHDGRVDNSPLTLLEQAGLLETGDNKDYMDFAGVRLIFAPNDVDPMSRDMFINKHSENYLMTHHMIVDKPVIYSHYLMEDFKTECSVVFCADYHPQQGIVKHNGVVFVSPGAIARRKLTKDNMERVPSCVYVSEKGFEIIPLKYNQDVWVEKDIEGGIAVMNLDKFNEEINDFSEINSLKQAWAKFKDTLEVSDEVEKLISRKFFG